MLLHERLINLEHINQHDLLQCWALWPDGHEHIHVLRFGKDELDLRVVDDILCDIRSKRVVDGDGNDALGCCSVRRDHPGRIVPGIYADKIALFQSAVNECRSQLDAELLRLFIGDVLVVAQLFRFLRDRSWLLRLPPSQAVLCLVIRSAELEHLKDAVDWFVIEERHRLWVVPWTCADARLGFHGDGTKRVLIDGTGGGGGGGGAFGAMLALTHGMR
mmetsp:Transcript_2052/g.3697  ORF Transcript_2052/g.3697 Transcript_2052/m.3697 type:complete len:218 (+) Transcript_2052:1714-2367(+)